MRRWGLAAGVLVAIALLACSGGDDDDAAEPTATVTSTPSATASPAATPSAIPTDTATPAATTPSDTATPSTTVTAEACSMFGENTPPATYFGLLSPGDVVRAFNRECGLDCGSFSVNGSGEWLIVVDRASPCLPRPGHVIEFYVNDVFTGHTESWRPGGAPEDLVTGIDLSAP